MELYHGSHDSTLALHEGICLVDVAEIAACYAGRNGQTYTVDLDLSGLTVEDCPGYDHDTNEAPADDDGYRADAAARGVDVLHYEDEDEQGRRHECWRLVSDRALSSLVVE